jgi:hypothetical protein
MTCTIIARWGLAILAVAAGIPLDLTWIISGFVVTVCELVRLFP